MSNYVYVVTGSEDGIIMATCNATRAQDKALQYMREVKFEETEENEFITSMKLLRSGKDIYTTLASSLDRYMSSSVERMILE